MKLLKCLGLLVILQFALPANAQSFKFAFLSDTIRFVVVTEDITEFGSDEELVLAKQILISAVERQTGDVLWQHKLSNSLINPITITGKNRILIGSMDGKITHFQYSPNRL